MTFTSSPHDQAEASASAVRIVSLSAYVDLPIAEVFARFQDPGIDGLMSGAMRGTLGDDGTEVVRAHAWPAVWVCAGTVRVRVDWHARQPNGVVSDGTVTVSLLTVQSGLDAITELLVAVPVSDEIGVAGTAIAHRILDDLTCRLEGRRKPLDPERR